MRDTIRSDIRRALCSWSFLAGTLGIVIVIASSSITGLLTLFANSPFLPDGYHAQIILDALSSNNVVLAVPIVCALPFTTAFVDDTQSGFIRSFLPRTGITVYIRSKLIASALAGGLVLAAGIFLAYVLSTLVLTPFEATPSIWLIEDPSFPILLEKVGVIFCSGMFWSLLGFTLASMTKNRYIAYASPFIVFYLLTILYERYFDTFYYIYPEEWLNPSHPWIEGNWGLILFLFLLLLVTGKVFASFARRKLSHG